MHQLMYSRASFYGHRSFLISFSDPFPYLIWEQGRAGHEASVKTSNVQAESHGIQKAYKSRLGVLRATKCDESHQSVLLSLPRGIFAG